MITVLSPSKTQDFTTDLPDLSYTQPALLSKSETLVAQLRRKSPSELRQLMGISDSLATLNHERYQRFSLPFTPDNAHPALMAFCGDVYTDIAVKDYSPEELNFAQRHLRILSGLYGLLRPLDLIQPYRLEMKTALENPHGSNLYKFWQGHITEQINKALEGHKNSALINLASQEYFKVIDVSGLDTRVIVPVFMEYKNGEPKVIAIYAKRARGKMANFIVKEALDTPDQLKTFSEDRYEYDESLSSENKWIFVR